MTRRHPTALISWSHTDPGWDSRTAAERLATVRALADVLRTCGIDAEVDLYHFSEGVDWTRWGPRLVGEVDRVLVVASQAWRLAWEGRGDPTRGAGAAAEADALRSLYAVDRDAFSRRVRVLVLPGDASDVVPVGLHGVERYHLASIDRGGVEPLVRDLTGQLPYPMPPLGPVPPLPPIDSGVATRAEISASDDGSEPNRDRRDVPTRSHSRPVLVARIRLALLVALAVPLCIWGVGECRSQLDARHARDGCRIGPVAALDDAGEQHPRHLLLIDMDQSGQPSIDASVRALRSAVEVGLEGGARFQLVIDRGADAPLVRHPCFDGDNSFRANERFDTTVLVDAILDEIASAMDAVEVRPQGGPLRLLQLAGRGQDAATVTTLVSDLLADDGTCLDEGDLPTDLRDAQTLALRCESSLAYFHGAVHLEEVGASDSSVGREQLAFDLGAEICARYARADCTVD